MELTLHLGAHRTGSTALMRCLMRNVETLSDEGVIVWPPAVARAIRDFPRVPVLYDLAAAGEPRSRRRLDRLGAGLSRRIAAEGGAAARLVLSEENMLGAMRENLAEASLYPGARRRLEAFASVLPQAPRRIGLGLRGYRRFWLSSYVYMLPRKPVVGRALPRFQDIAPILAQSPRGWVEVVEDIRAVFPGAEILLWRQEDLPVRMMQVAAALTGRPDAAGLRPFLKRVNASGDGADCDLIHHIRAREPGLTMREIQARLPDLRGKIAAFPPDFAAREAAHLAERYARDLAVLGAMGSQVLLLREPEKQ